MNAPLCIADIPSDPGMETVSRIISRIENGESERAACDAEGMNRGTFRSRALKYEAADQYARATIALAHAQIEKLEQTIEDMRAGTIDATVAKVEIDARKWFASKFLPKQFGDRTTLTGPDGGAVQVEHRQVLDVTALDAGQRQALREILQAALVAREPELIEGTARVVDKE